MCARMGGRGVLGRRCAWEASGAVAASNVSAAHESGRGEDRDNEQETQENCRSDLVSRIVSTPSHRNTIFSRMPGIVHLCSK